MGTYRIRLRIARAIARQFGKGHLAHVHAMVMVANVRAATDRKDAA